MKGYRNTRHRALASRTVLHPTYTYAHEHPPCAECAETVVLLQHNSCDPQPIVTVIIPHDSALINNRNVEYFWLAAWLIIALPSGKMHVVFLLYSYLSLFTSPTISKIKFFPYFPIRSIALLLSYLTFWIYNIKIWMLS